MSENDNTIQQEIILNNKRYVMSGTVNITLKEVTGQDNNPNPPPKPDPTKPTEFTVKDGGWGANMDPKTWVTTAMKDFPELFKVTDDKKKNVATHFKTQEMADNFIRYFQRHPEQVTEVDGIDTSTGGNGGNGGGSNGGGGPVVVGADEVAGIKLPYKTTGKTRVDDWHYNANDGLRADFEGNPKDGSYINSIAVFYGKFVGKITGKEDRAIKWSWGRHTGTGTKVNTYIVNLRNSDGQTRARMEVEHPNGYETMVDWGGHIAKGKPAKTGQTWGIMGVRRNVLDKDGKVKAVKLELYEDQGIKEDNKPANQWVKLLEHVDTKYLISTYPNGVEITGRFDDEIGDKNIKVEKALIAEVDPIKET